MIGVPSNDLPGHRGIETSVEAAESLMPHCARLQRMALSAIADAGSLGLTTEELAFELRLDRNAIQPRTSELRAKRLIQDSGLRRYNSSGKRAIVWTAREDRA